MSIKNFLMKKMLKSQMKGIPEPEQDKILNMIEKNPDLFEKIAKETQDLMKTGKDQMSSAMEVMKKYESDLKKIV